MLINTGMLGKTVGQHRKLSQLLENDKKYYERVWFISPAHAWEHIGKDKKPLHTLNLARNNMKQPGLLLRRCFGKNGEHRKLIRALKASQTTMQKSGLLMRGCWGKDRTA